MRVLIQFPPGKLTVDFETKGPPCPGCVFRQGPRDPDEVEACMKSEPPQSISGAVLKECNDKKWRKESLQAYQQLLEELRASRQRLSWEAIDDRPLLARIDDLFATLSESDQEKARSMTWMAWPLKHCSECSAPAVWVRKTQFSGNHAYCDEHAGAEADFGQDSSYFFWERVKT